jgi:phosphatidylglycerol:prolipoprotein diacylglycerol transferase
MHPVVFTLPFVNFPIHSYGLMLALSFICGIMLSSWLARRNHLNPEVISDAGFWIIIAAILGARLYYVFLHFDEFSGNLASIIWPAQQDQCGIGGLVMYGGVIGAIGAGLLYFKLKKITALPYLDIMAPSVGFGIFLTRIGCFLNGCCYGAPTTSGLGVTFPISSPAGHYQHLMHATALYPSQLFDSFGGLIIGIIVLAFTLKKVFTGFPFYLVCFLYAIQRFFVDFSRYYGDNERLGPLSHNQIVCIILFIIFGGMILKNILFREGENSPPGGHPAETPSPGDTEKARP